MSGLFEHIEMFDESDKVATRQAIAVANKRFNDKFASFLRQASTKKEFESRLALVNTDINNMVTDVVNEYGGDAEKIAAAIKDAAAMTHIATCDCDGKCEGMCKCGGCDDCKCDSKKTAGEMTPAAEPCENCGDEGCEHCTGDPEATKTAKEDRPEHLKAQDEVQLADEHSQVSPWLKKQIQDEDQEDGGNLRNKEANADERIEVTPGDEHYQRYESLNPAAAPSINSQPFANPTPLAKQPGYTAGGDNIDAALEQAPSAVGKGKEAGAHKVEEKDDKFYVTEKGEGEVAGPFDSSEDAHARANELNDLENLETEKTHTATMAKALALKAAKDGWVNEGDTVIDDGEEKKVEDIEQAGSEKVVELDDGSTEDIDDVKEAKIAADVETGDKTEERESLPKGDEDALDGPSPKMDKKKWVPNATNPDGNLEPIKTEGENSPHPTRQMDIKQKPDYQNDDPWEHDNNVWEREQLPSADDNAGFNTERNISQDGQSGTFPNKNQADPVTKISLPDALSSDKIAAMDRTASFRVFLNDIGMSQADFRNATDEQKSKLWDIYNNYDMPKYTEEEGLNVPLRDEVDALEAPAPESIEETPIEEEEVIIDETPESVEEIIEREDDDDDRVEVIDEDEDFDLDEDPFAEAENLSDEDLQDLIEEFEDNPDEY